MLSESEKNNLTNHSKVVNQSYAISKKTTACRLAANEDGNNKLTANDSKSN
jgi:hypothetical protein